MIKKRVLGASFRVMACAEEETNRGTEVTEKGCIPYLRALSALCISKVLTKTWFY